MVNNRYWYIDLNHDTTVNTHVYVYVDVRACMHTCMRTYTRTHMAPLEKVCKFFLYKYNDGNVKWN